jgi:hypothetical protein
VWPLWLLAVLLLGAVVATTVVAGDTTPVGEWRQSLVDWVQGLGDGSS